MTLSFRHARQASGITIGSEDSISWVDVDESDPLSSGLGERACFLDRLDMSGILLSSKLKNGRRTEKRLSVLVADWLRNGSCCRIVHIWHI